MFAIIQNSVIALLVPAGTAFEWNDISYPSNWLNLSSPEEKAAIGMVDVVYGQYPNDQYYWVSQDAPVYNGTVVEINYTATPKDLTQLKTQCVDAINAQAYSILLPTDWMAVKAFETGIAMDSARSAWRQTIRDQARDQVAAVNACTTVAELAALSAVDWASEPV
jgi:hypothetical protein